jgi:hypothetical protein
MTEYFLSGVQLSSLTSTKKGNSFLYLRADVEALAMLLIGEAGLVEKRRVQALRAAAREVATMSQIFQSKQLADNKVDLEILPLLPALEHIMQTEYGPKRGNIRKAIRLADSSRVDITKCDFYMDANYLYIEAKVGASMRQNIYSPQLKLSLVDLEETAFHCTCINRNNSSGCSHCGALLAVIRAAQTGVPLKVYQRNVFTAKKAILMFTTPYRSVTSFATDLEAVLS